MLNDYLLTCHRELAEERAAACPQPAQRLLAARAPGWAPLPWGANVRPYSVNLLTERALRRGALIAHLCCGWEWAAGCEAHVALAAAAAAGAKPPWFAAAAGPALWAAVGTKLPSDLARMRLVALVLGRILDAETGALGGAGGAAAGGGG